MKLFKNNTYHYKRVEEVSYELNIPETQIEEVLDIMYGYIREKLEAVDIDKTKTYTREEFEEIFPIIHFPSLGYLKPVYGKYKAIKKNVDGKNDQKDSE